MIKEYFIMAVLALAQLKGRAQKTIEPPASKLKKTEVELVYSHYIQDGDNSAITGGRGTEELTVYSTSAIIKRTKGQSAYTFGMGADIISSASTDNIDYVKSSASVLDTRTDGEFSYQRTIPNKELVISGGLGFSIESDYLSLSNKIGIYKENKVKLRSYSTHFSFFNDDLRWGRLEEGNARPQFLIYPSELRDTAWHNTYKRYSANLSLGFSQVLNKRNVLGVYPEFSYQFGLLATPFHRVYFLDGSLRVEQLPEQRYKGAIAIKLNSFVGGRTVLKHSLTTYMDSFGVRGLSVENETVFKASPFLSLLTNFRFYNQQGARFFKARQEHNVDQDFYTSDYDLSSFQTYSIGSGVKYYPKGLSKKKISFQEIIFRYKYIYRTNELTAHILSISFKLETENGN